MSSVNSLAIRLYRRFFGTAPGTGAIQADAVLDGSGAVALTEALISDSAILTDSPATQGSALIWRQQSRQGHCNSFGGQLESAEAESPRGGLAAAMGLSLSGRRPAIFLAADELAAAQDLLRDAAVRHLPLVIHLSTQRTAALGSSHEVLHQCADSGCFILFAVNVQEAADLTLIARRIAEQALIPGIVVMDGEQTALSAQELRLPSAELVRRYLGAGDELIEAPTPAQQMLFAEQRRRLPRWHDLDQPLLQGSLQGPEVFAHAVAGGSAYFNAHIDHLIDQAFSRFAELTGHHYHGLSSYRMEGARIALLAQGAAVETARAGADHLRRQHKMKVGVLGIRCLRPFPGARLVEQLAGVRDVAVLERLATPLTEETPLLRELRSALNRALDNGHFGDHTHPGYPRLEQRQMPRLHCGIYGIGGLHLRGADLITWGRGLKNSNRPTAYLGLEFHANDNRHPKRQVLLDRIRRAYPEIAGLGVRERTRQPILSPAGALTLKIYRTPQQGGEALIGESGAILQRLRGGKLRTQPGLSWDDSTQWCSDRLFLTPEGPGDCGRDTPVDVALATTSANLAQARLHWNLRKGGLLLVADSDSDPALLDALGPSSRAAIERRGLTLLRLPKAKYHTEEQRDAYTLGALFTALGNSGFIDQNRRQVLSAWISGLSQLSEDEQDSLSAAFEAGADALRTVTPPPMGEQRGSQPWQDEAPAVVRHLAAGRDTLESLPRFWDQVGVLYRNGEQDALSVDPFLSTATVPPLSSTFRNLSGSRRTLPLFKAANCSGCGACWSACPDSAIAVTALSPGQLISAGVTHTGADALRPLAAKLGARISAMARSGEFSGGAAADAITRAWGWLQERAQLPDTRRAAIEADIQSLIDAFGALPLAVTEPLFQGGESQQKDGGELLCLVINPDACKACGICTTLCQDEALSQESQDQQVLDAARARWRAWQQTPDTRSETIARLHDKQAMEPIAALMLSRYCALAMAGGDGAEAGSGEKIALRQVLAATEYRQQPLHHRFSREVAEARDQINDLIRETLTEALPTDDLASLAAGLDASSARQVDLGQLSRKGVDSGQMKRLVGLAQGLTEAHSQLAEGRHGLGRARYGLAIAAGSVARWACAFPDNPFQAPVTLDTTGNAAQLASGLLQGQLDEAIHTLDLLRRARRELDPGQRGEGQERLTWATLSQEERQLCPPLFLVGSEKELGGRGFNQIAWLLNSGLPVKVLVMSELDLGLDQRGLRGKPLAGRRDPRNNLGLMALAQRNAFVAQCSIAAPEHLHQSIKQALAFTGPALIRIHAPSPSRHGFDSRQTLAQARLALDSRAFPLFRYHPQGEGVFGSRMDLQGNPLPQADWALDASGEPVTPVTWALSEGRFASHFTKVTEESPAPTGITAWLQLEPAARQDKDVVITREEGRYRISRELLSQVEQSQAIWRTLQELAGLVTPFTEQVNREAEARVAAERQAELEALRAEYEARLAALEAQVQGEVAARIKGRLLSLAGYQ